MASPSEDVIIKVTDEDIYRVTEELGPDELKLLYAKLNIEPHKVEHAEQSVNSNDTILKARGVLIQWRQNKASAATRKALFDAKDEILKNRKGKSVEGSRAFDLQECQEQLRELYLGPTMKIKLTPWIPQHSVDMDTIFVNLELEKDEVTPSETKRIPLKGNENLVTLQSSTGLKVNRVLIQGEAGSGKSTLLDNIAYKWALQLANTNSDGSSSRSSPLSQFDLVFIIRLQDISDKSDSLEEIIFNQMLQECPKVSKPGLKSYLSSNAQKCLFLIDSIDEDNADILKSMQGETSLLLYNKMHRRSCVIASTRPDLLNILGHNLNQFTMVYLTGFSDKNIAKYVRKFFPEDEINCTNLIKELSEKQNIWSLAGTPLLLLLFCLLWMDPIYTKKSLPETRTKLYQETLACLWKRYHYEKKGLCKKDVLSEQSQFKMMRFLEKLGAVTVKGILDEGMTKVLFKDSDFEEKTLSLALGVGILRQKMLGTKLHQNTFIEFIHTSFQDFCFALYLAQLQLDKNKKGKPDVVKLMLACTPGKGDALIFCAGHKPETTGNIVSLVVAQTNIIHQKVAGGHLLITKKHKLFFPMEFVFTIAFEAGQNYEECHELVEILSNSTLPFSLDWDPCIEKLVQYQVNLLKQVSLDTNDGLFFSDLTRISFTHPIECPKFEPLLVSMLMYTRKLRFLSLTFKFDLKPNEVSNLSELFDAFAGLKKLIQLSLYTGGITEVKQNDATIQGKVDISNTLHKIHRLKLQQLCLVNMTVSVTSMAESLSFINKSVTKLTFLLPDLITNDTLGMMKAMSQIQTLSLLQLAHVNISGAVKYLQHIIPQLHELVLNITCLDEWDSLELAAYLGKATMLNKLQLLCSFHYRAVGHLADELQHMVKLEQLSLTKNWFGDFEAVTLVKGIKLMTSLCKLDLRGNDIAWVGHSAIESLGDIPQFKELAIEIEPLTQFHPTLPCFGWQNAPIICSLSLIGISQMPDMPNCCSCMSQIYNRVTCKMSSKKRYSVTDEELKAAYIAIVKARYMRDGY